jgi:hypothetical protein
MRSIFPLAALLAAAPAMAQQVDGAVTHYAAAFFAQYRPVTALDMVRHVPGFSYDPGDTTLRGLEAASGNVLVDGRRPAEKTVSLDDVLQRIPADAVERVDVVRGPTAGIDMLGRPVVANVVLRAGGGETAVTASLNGYGDGRIAPGVSADLSRDLGQGRSLAISVGLSRYVETTKGDGRRVRLDPVGRLLERADIRSSAGGTTGNLRTTFKTTALGGRLTLNGNVLVTDYQHMQRDTTVGPPVVSARLDEDLGGWLGGQGDAELGAGWTRRWSDSIDSDTTLLARIGRKTFTSALAAPGGPIDFAEKDKTSEMLARTSIHARLDSAITLQLDGEISRNRLQARSALSIAGNSIALPNARATVVEVRQNMGGQIDWALSKPLSIELALHYERAAITADTGTLSARAYPYLRPRGQLALSLEGGHQLRLRVEREVGQLDFANFAAAAQLDKGIVAAGNVALRPQTSWIAEGRWEWHGATRTNLALTLRRAWLRDVVDRVPVRTTDGSVTFDSPGNIGSGRQDIAIASATLPFTGFGLRGAELKLDGTARRSRVTDPTTGRQRGISGEKPYELTATFHQDLPRYKAAWALAADAGWRTRTYLFNEIDDAGQTLRLSASIDWNPTPLWAVHAELADAWGRRDHRTISAFAGARDRYALLYRDRRSLSVGPAVLLRVRRKL